MVMLSSVVCLCRWLTVLLHMPGQWHASALLARTVVRVRMGNEVFRQQLEVHVLMWFKGLGRQANGCHVVSEIEVPQSGCQ